MTTYGTRRAKVYGGLWRPSWNRFRLGGCHAPNMEFGRGRQVVREAQRDGSQMPCLEFVRKAA
jgi:hypothetical protein